MRFIGALPGLYEADPARVYLMGFSQGAALAYAAAMRYPGRFRGIAGLVGFVPVQCGDVTRMAPLSNTPVFMAVGKEDPLIPYERSVACAQTLQVAGCDLEYHEYDTGHKLTREGVADLKAWWADRARESVRP
jgi:phospholipase/carboxylesterase